MSSHRDNATGGAWLLLDMGLNIWALSIIKMIGLGYPASQLVFVRAVVGLIVILPWVLMHRHRFQEIEHRGLHCLRVLLSILALTFSFFAVARLPFALFTAIGFTRPLLMMALATLMLQEQIGPLRWLAAVIGLAGVIIAVHPSNVSWNWGMPAAFVTVFAGTGAIIVTRRLKGTSAIVMMTFYTAGLAIGTAPIAAAQWVPLPLSHSVALAAVGLFAQVAQYCFLQAHWRADAGFLGPLGYLSIVLSAGVGYVLFAEIPTLATLVGAAAIIAAAVLASRT